MSENQRRTEVTMTFSATVDSKVVVMRPEVEMEENIRHAVADLIRFNVGISDLDDTDVDISAVKITGVHEHNEPPVWSGTDREELATRLNAAADKTDDAQDHDELHAAADAVWMMADQGSLYIRRWVEQLQERWVL